MPEIGRHMNQQSGKSLEKGFEHSCSFSAGIQMPTSSRANKKKPCIAAKTTDTSSCQTFHYASHPGVVSFASPLVQQHCTFCQSSCLGHHPQDVPKEAGSRHARSKSSTARQSPLCPFPNMGPMLTIQGSSSSKWDFLCG